MTLTTERLEELRRVFDRLPHDGKYSIWGCEFSAQDILALLDAIDELKAGLEFYADRGSWLDMKKLDKEPHTKVQGMRARETLKKVFKKE